MALHVFVFVFLLVVCLLLSLALLWRLDWFHRQPSSSRGGARRTPVQRLLKPRSPGDCPACRFSSTNASVVGPAPVRPWCEVKSRRGAPKRIDTVGFACPNQQCPYYGITDAQIHALVGDGKHGQAERIQTFRCQACHTTFTSRRNTALYRLKTPSHQIAVVLTALAEGLVSTRIPCTSASFALCICHTSNWMNCEPDYAALTTCSGCGWPSTPVRRFFPSFSWVPAHNTWLIGLFTPCDRSSLLAAFPSLPVTA
jgi:hypothetical protein